jgi:Flp pilus assembly protein TadD
VDWTWFIPGPTIVALLAAAWVAGRGPRETWSAWITDVHDVPTAPARDRLRAGLRHLPTAGAVAALALTAIMVMWATWQPQRAVHAEDDALELVSSGKVDRARDAAERAHRIDPLAIEPLSALAVVEASAGRPDRTRAVLEQAVRLQPRNPTPWLQFAQFLLDQGDAAGAKKALGPALYLDPRSPTGVTLFLDAQRRLATPPPTKQPVTRPSGRSGKK